MTLELFYGVFLVLKCLGVSFKSFEQEIGQQYNYCKE